MVKSSTEEELTSSQEFMEALQFAGTSTMYCTWPEQCVIVADPDPGATLPSRIRIIPNLTKTSTFLSKA